MNIIISHDSALEYWRSHRNSKVSSYIEQHSDARKRSTTMPVILPSLDSIKSVIPSGLSYPVNIMIGDKCTRRKSLIAQTHLCTGHLPNWSFVRIGKGVSVSAPPLCFFQMADQLPLIKLIELGLEFCGTYSRAINNDNGQKPETADENSYGNSQLVSTNSLKSFTTLMKGTKGQKKAQRALRYITDDSASPMETILFMLLTLPNYLGGYGLPMPALNKRIDLRKDTKQRSDKSYYVCDLFWQEANLAVEYDSTMYHTGAERITGDSKKRLDLAASNITVITVTGAQIYRARDIENLAKLIAKKIGKQLRYTDPTHFQKAHRELRDLLFNR